MKIYSSEVNFYWTQNLQKILFIFCVWLCSYFWKKKLKKTTTLRIMKGTIFGYVL